MTTPAKQLVSDDPYATAVRLLQAAGVAEPASTAQICRNVSASSVEALAFLANTTQTADEVVEGLLGMDAEILGALLNMDHVHEAHAFRRGLAFRATGLSR